MLSDENVLGRLSKRPLVKTGIVKRKVKRNVRGSRRTKKERVVVRDKREKADESFVPFGGQAGTL